MKIKLDFETRSRAIQNMKDKELGGIEMSEFESAFLCGLIRKKCPTRILEVGVAGGGTTAIILTLLEEIGKQCSMVSIDASERYYRAESQKSGFMAFDIIKRLKSVDHRMVYGYLPSYIEGLGEGIDFCVLDTVHLLPGELLDFLVMLPFLNDGAVVVIHDISLNQRFWDSDKSIATNVLFSSVVGEKIIMYDESKIAGTDYPNIGAIVISKDTREYVQNLFCSLLLNWEYILSSDDISLYKGFYDRYYTKDDVKIFESAYVMNIVKAYPLPKEYYIGQRVAIYGAGNIGKSYVKQILNAGCSVEGWFDKDANEKNEYDGIIVKKPNEITSVEFDRIIIAVSDKPAIDSIVDMLIEIGVNKDKIVYKNMQPPNIY